jgi:Flp pilus assembly CpaE family ATPase
VIVDVGAELLGLEAAAAAHRAVIAAAHHVLLVAASDLVGLWHARTALDQLERQVGLARSSVDLVLNRHDARYHHSRTEVEWHLGARVVAVVPHDHAAAQRATADQAPLVLNARSRAARALIALAERVHEGHVRLPAATGDRTASGWRPWWRRVLSRPSAVGRRQQVLESRPLTRTPSGGSSVHAW